MRNVDSNNCIPYLILCCIQIDSQHEDMIHDSQFDYYAKKLATCSSDRTIKIFEVVGEKYILSSTLTGGKGAVPLMGFSKLFLFFQCAGHEGPVWQVAWAHPKFGVLLASCSYDGSVLVHREAPQNSWTRVHEYKCVDSSVNSVAWAPHEFGLVLACASSDGRITILEYKQDTWTTRHFQNDTLGCNSVSWAPANAIGSVTEDGTHVRRLVTGSCDNTVRVWRSVGSEGHWTEESKEAGPAHSGGSVLAIIFVIVCFLVGFLSSFLFYR